MGDKAALLAQEMEELEIKIEGEEPSVHNAGLSASLLHVKQGVTGGFAVFEARTGSSSALSPLMGGNDRATKIVTSHV